MFKREYWAVRAKRVAGQTQWRVKWSWSRPCHSLIVVSVTEPPLLSAATRVRFRHAPKTPVLGHKT